MIMMYQNMTEEGRDIKKKDRLLSSRIPKIVKRELSSHHPVVIREKGIN